MYEDAPDAENYDKYGTYYPKYHIPTIQSSLGFVTDYQRKLAIEQVSKWNYTCPNRRKAKIVQLIKRMNLQASHEDEDLLI